MDITACNDNKSPQMMASSDQGLAHHQARGLPSHPLLSCVGRGLSLALARGTSPCISSPECPWALSLHLGLPGQGLAPGWVDTTWKQGVAVETMQVWHKPSSHSQAGDGLGHHGGSQSLGIGSCKGLTQPRALLQQALPLWSPQIQQLHQARGLFHCVT